MINHQETILGTGQYTEFSIIQEIINLKDPFDKLWSTAYKLQKLHEKWNFEDEKVCFLTDFLLRDKIKFILFFFQELGSGSAILPVITDPDLAKSFRSILTRQIDPSPELALMIGCYNASGTIPR